MPVKHIKGLKAWKKEMKKRSKLHDTLAVAIGLPLFLLLIPVVIVKFIIEVVFIYSVVWLTWNTKGIHLLFVYSDSPNWQEYIETQVLPRLPDKRIVLNWSKRKQWKRFSLSTIIFRHFAGEAAFNPMAIVIRPFRLARVYRFYEPFKEFKHGKPESLKNIESSLFRVLNA